MGTAAGVVVPPRCDSFSRLLGAHHHATVPEEERRDFAEENQETEMESEAREELDRLSEFELCLLIKG